MSTTVTAAHSAVFTGRVRGGNQPVAGASLQLYAASFSGYNTASLPLLRNAEHTDQNGNFSITADYLCPAGNPDVYLVATGGNPGLSAGTDNKALAEMAALGPCDSLSAATFIIMNEVTTVGAVWPLAQFMSGSTSVATSPGNTVGLSNAFLNAKALVDFTHGTPVASTGSSYSYTLAAGNIVPAALIDTLANILAACINSTGSTAASDPCGKLFSASAAPSSQAPTDTIAAALSIALHPASQVAALYSLSAANAAFQPTLAQAPTNWLMGLTIVSPAKYPTFAAVDGIGNLWVLESYYGQEVFGVGQTSQFFEGSTSANQIGSASLAIDPSQNIWVSGGPIDQSKYDVYDGVLILSPTGSTAPCGINCGPFTGGGINDPTAIAIDGSGNAWMENDNGTLTELAPDGTAVSPTTGFVIPNYTGGDMAFDGSGNLWLTNTSANTVIRVTPAAVRGGAPATSTFSAAGVSAPLNLAVDHTGAVWIASSPYNQPENQPAQLAKLNSDGSVAVAGFAAGNCSSPLSVDGGGNLWTAANCEFSSTGSPIIPGAAGQGSATAIDNAGTLWALDGGTTSFSGGGFSFSIAYFGAAIPTGSPLSAGIKDGTLAQRP